MQNLRDLLAQSSEVVDQIQGDAVLAARDDLLGFTVASGRSYQESGVRLEVAGPRNKAESLVRGDFVLLDLEHEDRAFVDGEEVDCLIVVF